MLKKMTYGFLCKAVIKLGLVKDGVDVKLVFQIISNVALFASMCI